MRKPEPSVEKNNNSNNMSNSSVKLRKGLWSPEEDDKLMNYMLTNGQGCWSDVARNAGLQRCGKSCRLRWINYLRPDLKRGAFSPQEEELIIHLHALLGNRSLSLSLCVFFSCVFVCPLSLLGSPLVMFFFHRRKSCASHLILDF